MTGLYDKASDAVGETPSRLYNHLQSLRKRPGMYVGEITADRLGLLLGGWNMHRVDSPDGDEWAECFFANFHKFVEARYSVRRTIGWHGIIEEQAKDGSAQIELFFDLLMNFCVEYPPN